MKWVSVVAMALALGLTGCSTKWLPDAEAAINPPVAYQQQFIAEALDDCFSTMDFSRLRGQVVEIEVLGVYVDGDIADYCRSKLQVELAKAGAVSETYLVDKPPTYKANIMLARTMRAELHALGFEVEDLYPTTQAVDIDQVNQPTIWAWNIKAPDTVASHNLVLQIYLILADIGGI